MPLQQFKAVPCTHVAYPKSPLMIIGKFLNYSVIILLNELVTRCGQCMPFYDIREVVKK